MTVWRRLLASRFCTRIFDYKKRATPNNESAKCPRTRNTIFCFAVDVSFARRRASTASTTSPCAAGALRRSRDHPAVERHRNDRRFRQAGAAGPDRHPCPCLPIRHRPLRLEPRHGRRALRRYHGHRSGWSVLHDPAGFSAFYCRGGGDAGLCLPVGLSGRRPGGPLLPQSLQPRRRRHRRNGRRGQANKDIVRGIKGHAEIGGFARWGIKFWKCRPRSAAAPNCRSMCISARCGACPRAAPMARMPIPFWSA